MNTPDILEDLGHLALASRLKRLADAMLADAAKIHAESGEPIQPGQFPLVSALDRYGPMTVNDAAQALGISQPAATRAVAEAIKTGTVASHTAENDKRVRELSLTPLGRESVTRMKRSMWPRVAAAARELTHNVSGDILESIAEIERRFAQQSTHHRVRANTLSIVPFSDDLVQHFHDLNIEWIESMFTVEPHDLEVLMHPRENIIDKGGEIYFLRDGESDILGTCALERDVEGFVELTKMCVHGAARGRGAGEFLLRFILERAREIGCTDKLYLLSNAGNVAAVTLYEKLGFIHDAEILQRFGARYARCDVAMRFQGSPEV
ncbi:bifunctional helix-turn-helix transcriptional regulator/GNAT family N-acetyltransferase [Congregibacter brevis]|uniref:Bifunctional helix-turn-helix transcriptional regulator/GNAT family N-acetyltransferase n=1 Tax=Congregibacter brevis TaxID=3081201 RepID=A0ABZ0IEH8_9GAMM|nr:bifunctional helix-turn-helix transcriptional regulator/GNAT family N-acetyltransferase [Congregibacter sp. IMCC45268]